MRVPIILAPTEYGVMVIDGWHRVARATLLGLESLPGVILTEDEMKQVVLEAREGR